MPLTLSQVLSLILTVAAVVAVIFLVMFLNQLRRTAREAEKSLAKAQEVMDELKTIEAKLNKGLDDAGQVLQISRKAVTGVSNFASLVSFKFARPAARFLPFLVPLVRLALNQIKKKRRNENG